MPFIAKNPINSVALNSVPATPIPGTRSIFPMNDGWYEMDSEGNVRRLGADNIETITLTTITNNTITTSNELGSLRASKIYQLKIGDKTGWLIVSRLEEYEKNICQTLIDLDGSIYNRYHSEAGVGEEGWSEWEPYATKSDVDSKISDALDDRGIQIVRLNYNGTDVPNYDEFTTVGIYRINYEGRISWLIVANHNDLYHGITQILISSIGQISTRYNYVDETIADSVWTDWVEYMTQDIANNTYLSKTDAQNTYLTQSDAAATYLLPISPQVIQFIDVEAYDDIIAPGIYKNEHNIETTWLIVSQYDSAEHNYTQIKITSLGVIGYRYHNPSDSTWSEWIYYATQKDIKPKISMWKPNTHYYIDDTVIALDPDGYYYTATCKTEHISSNIDSMFMGDTSYWTIKSISSKQSFSAIYATDAGRSTQAEEDADGNIITATYATKEELRPTPITDISSTIIANKSYNYGEQTELSIAFPAVANDGDVVYITFTSGATATVLTIDTTNTSNIELIPEANTGYEIYAKYNGTIWIVNYSDYTVTTEAEA